jgi:hypothetical protein
MQRADHVSQAEGPECRWWGHRWYERAVEWGSLPAMVRLASCKQRALGCLKDDSRALALLEQVRGASRGSPGDPLTSHRPGPSWRSGWGFLGEGKKIKLRGPRAWLWHCGLDGPK